MEQQPLAINASRRTFLKAAGIGVSAAALGLNPGFAFSAQVETKRESRHRIEGMSLKNLADEYRARGFDELSDARLYRLCAQVVGRPCEGFTSFVLHAPLEVMARHGLLPLVQPAKRELARMHMLASATAFAAGVKPLTDAAAAGPFPDPATAAKELEAVLARADGAGVESILLQAAAQFGLTPLVALLAPAALGTLTAASHVHIGLWQLLRHGLPGAIEQAGLLRAAARMIGEEPKARLTSFSGLHFEPGKPLGMSPAELEKRVTERLTNLPKWTDAAPRGGIRFLMEACERSGIAETIAGDFIYHQLTDAQIQAAFRGLLRVSTASMLQDRISGAKFTWSHNLTQPQAACGLALLGVEKHMSLAASLVWTIAYRYVLGEQKLVTDWRPEPVNASMAEALRTSPQAAAARAFHASREEFEECRGEIATQAAIRNDQHLVKYTRTCFDLMTFDPDQRHLYLAAAAFLCAHWLEETPEASLLDRLDQGRRTP